MKGTFKCWREGICRVRFGIGKSAGNQRFTENFSHYIFAIFIPYVRLRDEKEEETEPGWATPPSGMGPIWPRHQGV